MRAERLTVLRDILDGDILVRAVFALNDAFSMVRHIRRLCKKEDLPT